MIGAKVTGYTLAIGDLVYVVETDDNSVHRGRVSQLAVAKGGLCVTVRTVTGEGDNVYRPYSLNCIFTSPTDAMHHAFAGGDPEL